MMGSETGADLLVVGAGPSGLAAALYARKKGVPRVLLLEKEKKTGRKLLASGNGRCNLSHAGVSASAFYSSEMKLFEEVFKKLPQRLEKDFFPALGIPSFSDEEGRLYPRSEEAASVQELLLHAVRESGVELRQECRVTSVSRGQKNFCVRTSEQLIRSRALLLACGSQAAPQLGGSASAKGFAEDLQLRYLTEVPALTALILGEKKLCRCASGGRFKGAVRFGQQEERGEFLFTDYGLSGIASMDLSSCFAKLAAKESLTAADELVSLKSPAEIYLDFFPELSQRELAEELHGSARALRSAQAELLLRAYLRERIIRALYGGKKTPSIEEMASQLKSWSLHVTALRGFSYAQVARGGLLLSNFNSRFEAKKIPGLFAAGEALDVSGRCGGYNLYWAFASGIEAGRAAGDYLQKT